MTSTTKTPPLKQARLAAILALLTECEMSNTQVATTLHLDRSVARGYLKDLRNEIYIARWERPRNNMAPVWRAGNLPDAEMPVDEGEDEKPKRRARVRVMRHWLDVALFGEYRRVA